MKKKKTSLSGEEKLKALCVILAGALIGSLLVLVKNGSGFDPSKTVVRAGNQTFVSVKNLSEDFLVKLGEAQELITHEGKTWLPVEGHPVEVIVLSDETCGQSCDPSSVLGTLRQVFTPALLVRQVDIKSEEGKALGETFEIEGLPAYIMGEGMAELKKGGEKIVESAQIAAVLKEKNGKYLIDSAKTGFRRGKFVKPPAFDLTNEPQLGNGPVRVVEFTDYECPFCKRLHDQNKDLINRFLEEGAITYYVKDFPLSFHKNASLAHITANCVLELAGGEAYWDMNKQLFDTQATWGAQSVGAAGQLIAKFALDLGLEEEAYRSCIERSDMAAEIQEDIHEGSRFGVSGTPALFIGSQIMPGAIGPEAFEAAVLKELER